MVNRQDIRDLNEQISTLIDAVDELEDYHEKDQDDNITVNAEAYAAAQVDVKEAVNELVHVANDMVDRTDRLEDDEGNTLVDLPNAALERASKSANLPDRE